MVYDITNYSSFENLEDWYQTAVKFCKDKKKVYYGLVANKCKNKICLTNFIEFISIFKIFPS